MHRVSVLDLDNDCPFRAGIRVWAPYSASTLPAVRNSGTDRDELHTRSHQAMLICISLHDVIFAALPPIGYLRAICRPIGRANTDAALADLIEQLSDLSINGGATANRLGDWRTSMPIDLTIGALKMPGLHHDEAKPRNGGA